MTAPSAVLLTPGAGSDRDHPTLAAIEAELAPLPVRRIDFPYRRAGRKAPDRAPKLIACIVEEVDALAEELAVDRSTIVLGGRSMGGRMCSMAVAQGLPAAGLILLSYPLHPPGKPEKLRVEHLPQLTVPCLFVGGDRDPFGTPDEIQQATATIPGPVEHVWLSGQRHSPANADDAIIAAIADWLTGLTG